MPAHVEIPKLRTMARHAVPHLIEATFIPLALFYAFLWTAGVWGALIAALCWSYIALIRRMVTGQRIPGILVLGALGITARTIAAFASGSTFVYFLQPSLTTIVVAGAFLLSVPAGRPLAERLAHDFVPLDPEVMRLPAVKRVFVRITLLWAFVNLANAIVSIALLMSQPVGAFVAFKTVIGMLFVVAAVTASTVWFKRALLSHNVAVSVVGPAPVVTGAPGLSVAAA
jgi:intracellular septation protein A